MVSKGTVEGSRLVQDSNAISVIALDGSAHINATGAQKFSTTLVGNAGNNRLTGGETDDVLYDGTFVDTSNGNVSLGASGGVDTLAGGKGNDAYYVGSSTTKIEEAVNSGDDSVFASVNYTLGANVEHLILVDGATKGTGNNLANNIDASRSTENVVLVGSANAAGQKADTLTGGAGDDNILSYNAYDVINGGAGNNILHIYYTVAEYERLSEADKANFDWAGYFSRVNADIKNIQEVIYVGSATGVATARGVQLQGSANATYLQGTDRSDTILAHGASGIQTRGVAQGVTLDGGLGADYMGGGAGNDKLYVDNAGDSAHGGGGVDSIFSTVNIDLNDTAKFSGIEEVHLQGTAGLIAKGNAHSSTTLLGNTGANQLFGGSADDVLDGGLGADVMTGGAGDDLYFIDNVSDRVVEKAGEGVDSIISAGVHINLGGYNHANVEHVSVTGNTGVSLTGTNRTDVGETLIGGAGNDTIDGKGGADVINAGDGRDTVYFYNTESIVDGGDGWDKLIVRANTGNVTLGTNITNFEVVELENSTQTMTVDGSAMNSGFLLSANTNMNNVYVGGSGHDTLEFGSGNDSVRIKNDGAYRVVGATETKFNATNFEAYAGGLGNDTIDGSAATTSLTLLGAHGKDVVTRLQTRLGV